MLYLYFFALRWYAFAIWLASFFNAKARQWTDGRKNLLSEIRLKLLPGEKRIWFHCSSFGEFEQGRPVLQSLKKKYPDHKTVLTFFSPSGIEQGKKEPAADYVFYMPLDGLSASEKFIEAVKPEAAFFVKYDYWYGYMAQLHRRNIPTYFISAVFRTDHYFFKWYGSWFLNQLKKVTCFFVQDQASKDLLDSHKVSSALVTGDTRFDRVSEFSKNIPPLDRVSHFKNNKQLIVAGSTWPEDENLLAQYINSVEKEVRMIIVPHEIKNDKIEALQSKLQVRNCLYTSMSNSDPENCRVLIVDTVGMLSKIYQYADVCYIGGGFGKGIHNILEAVVFGNAVLFGRNYQKFKEARDLVKLKGAFPVNDFASLKDKLDELLSNEKERSAIKKINHDFIAGRTGATQKITGSVIL